MFERLRMRFQCSQAGFAGNRDVLGLGQRQRNALLSNSKRTDEKGAGKQRRRHEFKLNIAITGLSSSEGKHKGVSFIGNRV